MTGPSGDEDSQQGGGDHRTESSDNGDRKIVINELLSYCSYHLDSSSTDSIEEVVLNFYHPDEIIAARNVLSTECAGVAGTAVRHRNHIELPEC